MDDAKLRQTLTFRVGLPLIDNTLLQTFTVETGVSDKIVNGPSGVVIYASELLCTCGKKDCKGMPLEFYSMVFQ